MILAASEALSSAGETKSCHGTKRSAAARRRNGDSVKDNRPFS